MNTSRICKTLPIIYNKLTISFLGKFYIIAIAFKRIFKQFSFLKRIQRLLHVAVFSTVLGPSVFVVLRFCIVIIGGVIVWTFCKHLIYWHENIIVLLICWLRWNKFIFFVIILVADRQGSNINVNVFYPFAEKLKWKFNNKFCCM